MVARLVCALGLALVAAALASDGEPQDLPETLLADDECQAGGATGGSCGLNALQLRGEAGRSLNETEEVRILHISDTHNLHGSIEDHFPLPPADILIHSGDFTNFGTAEEFEDANAWLGSLKPRYKHILAITGNHDWITSVKWVDGNRVPYEAAGAEFWRRRLSNAEVLLQEAVTVMGLKIFGSSWRGEQHPSNPHGFGEIPGGMDVLVTHGPPAGILDWSGDHAWGSSDELVTDIVMERPKLHLFGHVHEQRGLWQRPDNSTDYLGGVQYEPDPGSGRPFATEGPPPAGFPPQVLSNNAMMNAPNKEGGRPPCIAGPGRLILAKRINGSWHFHA